MQHFLNLSFLFYPIHSHQKAGKSFPGLVNLVLFYMCVQRDMHTFETEWESEPKHKLLPWPLLTPWMWLVFSGVIVRLKVHCYCNQWPTVPIISQTIFLFARKSPSIFTSLKQLAFIFTFAKVHINILALDLPFHITSFCVPGMKKVVGIKAPFPS